MLFMINLQAWVVNVGGEKIVDQFHQLVPDMALNFPFELDPFQKEVTVIAKPMFTHAN